MRFGGSNFKVGLGLDRLVFWEGGHVSIFTYTCRTIAPSIAKHISTSSKQGSKHIEQNIHVANSPHTHTQQEAITASIASTAQITEC